MKANFTEEELTLLKSIINKITKEEEIVKPDYSNVKVGDYMLKDGTTVSPDEITKEQKSQAIGIVAYLYGEQKNEFLKNGIKAALKAKGIENPHGLVIALNDAGNGEVYKWSKIHNPKAVEYKTLNEQVFHGEDGLEMTNRLTKIEDYPAFKVAKEYEKEVQAPKNTTGWYLPSIGEWFCLLNHYKLFSKYIGQDGSYWSSSEYSSDYAYHVGFYSDGGFDYSYNIRTNTNYVRPVLAF